MSGTVDDADNTMTLAIGGQIYSGWESIRCTRAIDRMCSDFDLTVSERWAGQLLPWQIHKFDVCKIKIGDDAVLTGYVDTVAPSIDGTQHRVRIAGRSKTADIVDCMPDVASGQFKGYTLAAVARSIAALFGIEVLKLADGPALGDVMLERCETAYEFLERLGRLSAVLITDNEEGRLVLSRTGDERAHDAITLPGNVLRADAALSGIRQFSRYVIKNQHSLEGGKVNTQQEAVATDPSVPRFRQHVAMAESELDAAGMAARVRWQAIYAAGRSTEARVTVQGWRQSNGDLWRINRLVSVSIPQLQLDRDLLIVSVTFSISEAGTTTELTLGPPEGYTPDPGEVKWRKHKNKRGGGEYRDDWAGAGGIK